MNVLDVERVRMFVLSPQLRSMTSLLSRNQSAQAAAHAPMSAPTTALKLMIEISKFFPSDTGASPVNFS